MSLSGAGYSIYFSEYESYSSVTIYAPGRADIERAFAVFDRRVVGVTSPEPPPPLPEPPTVFIGHGRSPQWRDLKDHLHDLHGYRVEAYEVGARAGHTIRDILGEMLENSTFALLVMTAEDETSEGGFRARQNVIHETGLFQGRLGFARAIVLVEEGVEDYSNLQGLHQLRYRTSNIKEVFGDVLATLRREFPPQ
jgi:predicted nucleotide-binding protein